MEVLPTVCNVHRANVIVWQTRYLFIHQRGETLDQKEAVYTGQGTRLSEKAPWESYAYEMEQRLAPDLEAAVAEYSKRSYIDESKISNQNKEAAAEQKEFSDGIAKQYQWLTPEEYADIGARIGRVMAHTEFITLLRKAGVHAYYQQHLHADKANLLIGKDGFSEPTVECWVQIGQMPELSIMNFDDHGAPLAERRRGWRTPLLQLILKGIISEAKAIKFFGRPKETEQFHKYNALVTAYRNSVGAM
jgi:hypothetical protein